MGRVESGNEVEGVRYWKGNCDEVNDGLFKEFCC